MEVELAMHPITRKHFLVDLDHTLSNAFWRDGMISDPALGWDDYHAANKHDHPLHDVVNLINALSAADAVIVGITARPGKWRKQTMEWCVKHGVLLDELLMRPDDNYLPAPELKIDLATAHFAPEKLRDCVAAIFDDHEQVCAAFKAEGVTAFHVHARRGQD